MMNAPIKWFLMMSIALCAFACASDESDRGFGADSSGDDRAAFDAHVLEHGAMVGTAVELVSGARNGVLVHVNYLRSDGQAAPRMAEFYLNHSANLQFVDVVAGSSALAADKTVVGQVRGGETVRVVVYSVGHTATFDSGRVASLRFAIEEAGPIDVSLQADRQLFAPVDANAGLVISDPQSVMLGE